MNAEGKLSKHSVPSTAKKTKIVSSSTGVPITPVSSSTKEVNAILVEQLKADKRTIRALQYNLSTLETAALIYSKQLKQENDARKHEISMIQMVMSSNSAFSGFTWPVVSEWCAALMSRTEEAARAAVTKKTGVDRALAFQLEQDE